MSSGSDVQAAAPTSTTTSSSASAAKPGGSKIVVSGSSGQSAIVAVGLIGALVLLLVLFSLIFSVIAYLKATAGIAGPPGAPGPSGPCGPPGQVESAAVGISTDTYTIPSTSPTRFYVFTAQPNGNTTAIMVNLPLSSTVPGAVFRLANVQSAAGLIVSVSSSGGDTMTPNTPTVLAAGEIAYFNSDGFGHWYVLGS